MTVTASCTLDGLGLHRRARVVRLEGDDTLTRRLHDLGFWPSAEVEVLHSAPWADPAVYGLHNFRIALRRDEAVCVVVEPTTR